MLCEGWALEAVARPGTEVVEGKMDRRLEKRAGWRQFAEPGVVTMTRESVVGRTGDGRKTRGTGERRRDKTRLEGWKNEGDERKP